jgi:hypothetical protein
MPRNYVWQQACSPATTYAMATCPTERAVSDERKPLMQENIELRKHIASLRHDIADLQATVALWRKLYEDAIRRQAERESVLDGSRT